MVILYVKDQNRFGRIRHSSKGKTRYNFVISFKVQSFHIWCMNEEKVGEFRKKVITTGEVAEVLLLRELAGSTRVLSK